MHVYGPDESHRREFVEHERNLDGNWIVHEHPSRVGTADQSYRHRTHHAHEAMRRTAWRVAACATAAWAVAVVAALSAQDRALTLPDADSTFTLTQPLLRGFGSRVARRPLDAAEMRRADAGRQQIVSEQQVAVDVASAFYRVLAQQSLVRVAQQSLERSRRLRDASEAK